MDNTLAGYIGNNLWKAGSRAAWLSLTRRVDRQEMTQRDGKRELYAFPTTFKAKQWEILDMCVLVHPVPEVQCKTKHKQTQRRYSVGSAGQFV